MMKTVTIGYTSANNRQRSKAGAVQSGAGVRRLPAI
jgi:hypothetical protein